MKESIRFIYLSLIGCFVTIIGIYILSLFGFADPFKQINELFLRYAITPSYDYSSFGAFYQLWAISSFLPIIGLNFYAAPINVESFGSLILFSLICATIGYKLKFPKGVYANFLLLVFSIVLGLLLSIVVPSTLPVAGLPPDEHDSLLSLGDEFATLTLFSPLNMPVDLILTIGLCLVTTYIGAFIRNLINPEKTSKKKSKKTKKKKK